MLKIGKNLDTELKEFLKVRHSDRKIVIITDKNVDSLHRLDIAAEKIVIEPGEKSKSRSVKAMIEDKMLDSGCNRKTVIIALGGGVVGDLAGFVASTFMRGIPVIQVPTTLLAMLDSSVGGKTGINTRHGKNLIGSFWPADAVFIDTKYLETLPEEELINGSAEAIKMGLILDKVLFDRFNTEIKDWAPIIKRCVELKQEIVEKDFKESGPRKILNFGHTVGHAIESISDFELRHGQCVSLGIVAESSLSVLLGHLNKTEFNEIVSVLKKNKLPTKLPGIDEDMLTELMKHDKKNQDGIRMILLEKIGKSFEKEVSENKIKEALQCLK